VKFGVHLPQWGVSADRAGVLAVARTAEAAGLDSVWVADHIAYPVRSESVYPYRPAGLPFRAEDGFLEALTTLAVVAGATERVELGTSVLVLPMREPLLVAKTVSTLDVLSGGRALLAVGVGWWREEYEAVGAPFDRRGARFDDQLRLLRKAWSEGVVGSDSGSFRFDEVTSLPTPVRPGGPPLLIGGMGRRALLRTVQFGDAWHAVGSNIDTLRAGRATLDVLAAEHGRDAASIGISTSTGFGRSVDQAQERIGKLAEFGVSNVVLNVPQADASAADVCAAIETFAGDVLPALAVDADVYKQSGVH
jgi:probable F420-dependent oxidoreductase